MATFGFPRQARLKRRRLIRPLFDRNRRDVGTLPAGSVRLLYRVVPRVETGGEEPVQVAFATTRTRSSVKRNALRRTLREVYRTHQDLLPRTSLPPTETVTLMILALGSSRERIRHDLPLALQQLTCRLHTRTPQP